MLGRKKSLGLLALVGSLTLPAMVKADSNEGEVRRSIESQGGSVHWGKQIDHLEYAKAVIAIASGNGGAYLNDLAAQIVATTGGQVGLDLLNKVIKGETINLNGKQIQGGVVSYNHWKTIGFHKPQPYWNGPFDNGIRWVYVTEKVPLPNTHQFYVRIK